MKTKNERRNSLNGEVKRKLRNCHYLLPSRFVVLLHLFSDGLDNASKELKKQYGEFDKVSLSPNSFSFHSVYQVNNIFCILLSFFTDVSKISALISAQYLIRSFIVLARVSLKMLWDRL